MRKLHVYISEELDSRVNAVQAKLVEMFPDAAITVVAYGSPRRGFILSPDNFQPEDVSAASQAVNEIIHE